MPSPKVKLFTFAFLHIFLSVQIESSNLPDLNVSLEQDLTDMPTNPNENLDYPWTGSHKLDAESSSPKRPPVLHDFMKLNNLKYFSILSDNDRKNIEKKFKTASRRYKRGEVHARCLEWRELRNLPNNETGAARKLCENLWDYKKPGNQTKFCEVNKYGIGRYIRRRIKLINYGNTAPIYGDILECICSVHNMFTGKKIANEDGFIGSHFFVTKHQHGDYFILDHIGDFVYEIIAFKSIPTNGPL